MESKRLTMDEVITKWDKKHHRVLKKILFYVNQSKNNMVKIPKSKSGNMLIKQIMHDLGYKVKKSVKEEDIIYLEFRKIE